MEVGIDLKAVYEEGSVFEASLLAIDEEQTLADIQSAFNKAFNLSVYAAIPTEETISTIISTAHRKAVNVAVEAGIVNSETSDIIIGLAHAKMLALAGELSSDAIDDELADKLANRASAAAPVVEEAPAEEEEEEEEEEDEAAAEERVQNDKNVAVLSAHGSYAHAQTAVPGNFWSAPATLVETLLSATSCPGLSVFPLFSALLAIVLVFSMCTVAFAADTGTITIDKAVDKAKYNIYKMLSFAPSNDEGTKGIYTIVDGWVDFFNSDTAKNYFEVTTVADQTTVVLKDGVNAVDQTIAKEAIALAKEQGYDYVILDTAGRLHVDEELMNELKAVKAEAKPHEILLVVDAMTGQDAVNVAQTFNDRIGVDGVILTKLDGDTRGGVALSVRHLTNIPIKFIGVSEKMDGLSEFHPDRMANRIIGMGDVISLVEKVESEIDEKEAMKLVEEFHDAKEYPSDPLF